MHPNIPTTRLRGSDKAALLHHFLQLDPEDRRLRFGAPIDDDRVRDYVKRLDMGHDGLFAVHDDALDIVAAVHVALGDSDAELGLSVLPHWRSLGVGNALVARAVVFLRNRGVRGVFVHCLAENAAMLHIARKNRMQLQHFGGEANARLALQPPTPDSYLTEWLEDQRGTTVKSIRQNRRNARALLGW